MKVFVVISVLIAAAASADVCYSNVAGACKGKSSGMSDGTLLANCNAKYGSFEKMEVDLQKYVNAQIEASFEYLLMSSFYGNYQTNRDGFKSLYRKLSDQAWDDAFDLIKFISKRGGVMNFGQYPKAEEEAKRVFDHDELASLAKALDTQKRLADETLTLHARAQYHSNDRDGSVAHYLEERFMEPQADCVRKLAGHITDLKQLLSGNDESVSVFIFDEYLQKSL